MLYKKNRSHFLLIKHIISIPFIYLPCIPLIVLDLCIELYHQVGFRLYGIPRIKRSNYIVFDRAQLSYVKGIDKLHCTYCAYANGFLEYAVAIAGATEAYWCGIKHNNFDGYVEPRHHKDFAQYGDEEDFKKKYIEKQL